MDAPNYEEMNADNSDGNNRRDHDAVSSRESSPDIFPASKIRWDPRIIEIYPDYFDDESEAEEDTAALDSEEETASLVSEDGSSADDDVVDVNQLDYDIHVRYQDGGYFQVIAKIPGGDNRGYCYTFDESNNRFVCGNCQRRDHSTVISLNSADDGTPAFYIEKNHVCDPIDFSTKKLFGHDHFREVDEELVVELGDDQSIRYRFLEPSNNFLCIGCESSGSRNEAVLYHDEGGDWFAECDLLHVCQAGGTVEREADSNNDVASNAGNASIQEPSDFDYDFDNGNYGGDMNPSGSDELFGVDNAFTGRDAEDEDNFDEGNAEQSDESRFSMMDSFEDGNRDSTLQSRQMNGSVALNSAGSTSEDVEVEDDGREEDVDIDDQQKANKSPMVLRKRRVFSYASEDAEEVVVAKKSKQSNPKSKSALSRQPVSDVAACEEGDAQIETKQKRNHDRPFKHIFAPNFEERILVNGSRQLFIFPFDNDRTKCYRYLKNGPNSFYCSRCWSVKVSMSALCKKGVNGVEFVDMTDAHVCEPVKYYGTHIAKITNNFEEYSNEHGRELFVFNGDDQLNFYFFYWHVQSKCYACSECMQNKKFTSALVKTDENGEKYLSVESVHACQPQQYIPKIHAPNFLIRHTEKGNPELVVFVDGQRELCYKLFWRKSERSFVCGKCTTLKKSVTASIWKLPTGEEFAQMYKPHVCQPIRFVEHL